MKDQSARRLRRIQIISKIFQVLCVIGMAAVVLMAVTALFNPALLTFESRALKIQQLKPEYGWVKQALALGILTITATFLWLLYRLFDLYRRGTLFGDANVRYIKHLGYWMLAIWALHIPMQLLQFLTVLEAGRRFTLNVDGFFLGGLLVILLAWIMEEGKKLEDEQSLTV
jgi:hypothetical protein